MNRMATLMLPALCCMLPALVTGCGSGKSGDSASAGAGESANQAPGEGEPAPALVLTLMADSSTLEVGKRIRFSARFESGSDEAIHLVMPSAREALGVYDLALSHADGKPLGPGVLEERFRSWKSRPVQVSQVFDELQPGYTSILSLSRLLDKTAELAFTAPGTYRARLTYDTSDLVAVEKALRDKILPSAENRDELLEGLKKVRKDRVQSQDLVIEVKPREGGTIPAPLRMTLRVPRQTIVVGEAVDLKCEIENVSSGPLTLLSPKARRDLGGYTLVFEGAGGKPLEKGALVEGGTEYERDDVRSEEIFLDLAAGERVEVGFARTLYNTVWYEFAKPGEYRVRFVFELRDRSGLIKHFREALASNTVDPEGVARKLETVHMGRLVSNTLAISVVPD